MATSVVFCASVRVPLGASVGGGVRGEQVAVGVAVIGVGAGVVLGLRRGGLVDWTIVMWTGEFGRSPSSQGPDGRDHNRHAFSLWLAGGGFKKGCVDGATDDFGYFAVENKVHVHDLHATMLHLLGIDHKRLTYRYSGRDMRLTDVHGNVVQALLH